MLVAIWLIQLVEELVDTTSGLMTMTRFLAA
ncbi:hypothetical protein SHPE106448_03325 [Shewanella pealeana]